METTSRQSENELEILNKESELKSKGYYEVNESEKLKPLQYSKAISSGSENTFEGTKKYRITWHI